MLVETDHQVLFTLTRIQRTGRTHPLSTFEPLVKETELVHMLFGHPDELEVLESLLEMIELRIGKLEKAAEAAERKWCYDKQMRIMKLLDVLTPGDMNTSPSQLMDKALRDPDFPKVRETLSDRMTAEWILEKFIYSLPSAAAPEKVRVADDTVQIPVISETDEEDVTEEVKAQADYNWAQPDGHVRESGPIGNVTA